MTLKTATTIALIGIFCDLLIGLINWLINVFHVFSYSEGTVWISYTIWMISLLLSTIPIMIFLFVLRKKQQGGENG